MVSPLGSASRIFERVRERGELAWFRRGYEWDEPGEACGRSRLILLYNGVWGPPAQVPEGALPPGWEATSDLERFRDAAAVVFHVPSLGSLRGARKFPGQLWVAQSAEAPVNFPRLRDPAFMGRFDLTIGYRGDSDVRISYLHSGLARGLGTPPAVKDAPQPAAMLVSSRHNHSRRREYARELMRHVGVASYGRVLRNARVPGEDRGLSTKLELISRHKFTLAFENAIAPDYVTEKFFDPLAAGSVPVYLGAPNVADYAPGADCFIDVSDFAGPAAVGAHLRALDADAAAYAALHAWRERPWPPEFQALVELRRTHPIARLCAVIEGMRGRKAAVPLL